MQLYLYNDGIEVSEIVGNIVRNGQDLIFICRPPIFIADSDYDIRSVGDRPMKIMITKLVSDGIKSHINAVEL